MRRIVPILVAAAMIISVSVVILTDEDSAAVNEHGMYINGHEITDLIYHVDEGTEHWTYEFSTGNLTIEADSVFSSYCYIDNGYETPASYGIYQGGGGGVNIILNGNLLIEGLSDEPGAERVGIYTVGEVTVSGSGKLTIKSASTEHHFNEGITANGSININSGTVEIHSGSDLYSIDGDFHMNGGELDLVGSGSATGESVYITGGTINIDGSTGSTRNVVYAKGDHGATFDMTGGSINFANCTSGQQLLYSISMWGSETLNLHGATGKNWVVHEDHFVDAVNDGPASITINSSLYDEKKDLDDNIVIGVVAAVGVMAFAILLLGFIGRKQ